MERDDDNYGLMCERRARYMDKVVAENTKSGVKMNEWEREEIEMAYEEAFQVAFVLGFRDGRRRMEN